MKKTIAIFLSLLLVFSGIVPAFAADAKQDASFGAYERVFIIGIDGAGRFIKDADTPNFDRIFKDGAVRYTARAEVKTDSGPNWGAILTGASVFKTGLQNSVTGKKERDSSTDFPTIFTFARKAFPDAELASFVHWDNINYGIIENDVGVRKTSIGDDVAVTDAICDYFDAGNQPKLFFVQLDDVDHAGHDHGSKSEEYFTQMHLVDGYLGRIYDAIERNGLLEDALFIVVDDHGHTRIGGHGGLSMRETNVTVAVKGKTVVSGGGMDADTRNRDVAAIALYALGVDRPDTMTARVPANLFTDKSGEKRPVQKDVLDTVLGALSWVLTLFTSLFG